MRDTTNTRKELDRLRVRLAEAWAAPVYDLDLVSAINLELRELMEREKEKRRIIIPIFDCVNLKMTKQLYPSADQVAAAVVAAAREFDADPEQIAAGGGNVGHRNFGVSRARAYAALALRAVFQDEDGTPGAPGNTTWGRMVGGNSMTVLSVDTGIKNGTAKWWDDKLFMRVVAALETTLVNEGECPTADTDLE